MGPENVVAGHNDLTKSSFPFSIKICRISHLIPSPVNF